MKQYIRVFTTSLVGGGFAGANEVEGWEYHPSLRVAFPASERTPAQAEAVTRAEEAARSAFAASGKFPGHRHMAALVRVDGGRAVVCGRRGRRGW